MATISIAIAIADSTEAYRKKQGDIIAIKPGGWQWGGVEVKEYLILEVAIPSQATLMNCQALSSRYYSGGVLTWDGIPPEVIAKRRFRVPWTTLKTLIAQADITVDWAKVEDPTVAYQPLSRQDAAPGGTNATLDPTKLVFDKYENRLVKAIDFTTFIVG